MKSPSSKGTMERRHILQSQPCQELFYRICELLEERIGNSLDFFLEKSRLGKGTALREMGFGNVLLLLIIRSLEQGDTFLLGILMELARDFAPLGSPFLTDWLHQDFRIERETVHEALEQAIRLNSSRVILVPDSVLQILINLAQKSGIEIDVAEAPSGTVSADEGAPRTSQLVAAAGPSYIEGAAAGPSYVGEAAAGPSSLEDSAAGGLLVKSGKPSSASSKKRAKISAVMDLHTAASSNRKDVVQALLVKGVSVDAVNSDGETAMGVAVTKDFDAIVDVLLKNKADIRRKNKEGDSYLHVAAACRSPASLRKLLENGAPVDSVNRRGETPLAVAVKKNDPGIIKILVEFHADVRRKTGGQTYLHQAVKDRSLNSLRALLECGVPPDLRGSDGMTPIAQVVRRNDTESAAILAEFGADLNQTWGFGGNLLHYAAWNGSAACIRWLVNRGLHVDSTDGSRWTPLHCAAYQGKLGAAMLLVELNCTLNLKDVHGETPYRLAQNENHEAVAAFLRPDDGSF